MKKMLYVISCEDPLATEDRINYVQKEFKKVLKKLEKEESAVSFLPCGFKLTMLEVDFGEWVVVNERTVKDTAITD